MTFFVPNPFKELSKFMQTKWFNDSIINNLKSVKKLAGNNLGVVQQTAPPASQNQQAGIRMYVDNHFEKRNLPRFNRARLNIWLLKETYEAG